MAQPTDTPGPAQPPVAGVPARRLAAVWVATLPLCALLVLRLTRLQDDRGKPVRRAAAT
jgi:hypothetical protein